MNQTKNIALYARVSTARQEEEQTIQTQIAVLNEYASKNGYNIVESYLDDGWSGDSIIRPSLDKMRQDVKRKIFEAVLIYDPDRLARRYSYQELIMDELRDAGIEVIFITIASPKNSEDKILHGVRGLFAEYERAKISERFRLGKIRKIKEGHLMVSIPSYGYTYIKKQDNVQGYYKINESEARVIKLMFNWIAEESVSLKEIVRRLQENAIPPRYSKRGVWNTSTLSTIFRNRAYIGEAHWGSSYSVVPEKPISKEKYRKVKKSSRKLRPLEEWYTIPVPKIIEPELFNRVQTNLKRNSELSKRNKKNNYLLSGLLWCECGSKRIGEGPNSGKYLYYRCSQRVKTFPLPADCKLKGVNACISDDMVWKRIVELFTSPELIKKQLQRWESKNDQQKNQQTVSIEDFKKEIDKHHSQIERYNKAYGAELITIEQLKEYTNPIKSQIQYLENKITMNKQNDVKHDIILPDHNEIEHFVHLARESLYNMDFAAKQMIIRQVVKKITTNTSEMHITGHLPILNQNYVKLFTSNRNGQDATQQILSPIHFEYEITLPPPMKLFGNK